MTGGGKICRVIVGTAVTGGFKTAGSTQFPLNIAPPAFVQQTTLVCPRLFVHQS